MSPDEADARRRHPSLIRNKVSAVGGVIIAITLGNILFVQFAHLIGIPWNPYFGIFAYLVFPFFLLLGLLLLPIGMLIERRRRRKYLPEQIPPFPRIDLNTPRMRRALGYSVGVFLLFIIFSAAVSYRAYKFTDSVSFCGQICHKVMKPEYTAYQDSPHARVPCASCHVGPTATLYVRSKLSGAHQVYAVMFNNYPRPIATPIRSLRPVRQACEQCHWPKMFYGAQLKVFTHYAYDKNNTSSQIWMLIKTGGGSPEFGPVAGIHWHMYIANKIWFIATDKQHQVIPWVKVEDAQGAVTVYSSKDSPLTSKQVKEMPKHLMDCVTCHSRASHNFRPPDQAVDEAMAAGKIDTSLPFIKTQAVSALTASYSSTERAQQGIATDLRTFYSTKYPAVYAKQQGEVKEAIAMVQTIYKNNFFPYMKVDWRTHPDNIGHLYYPGCFRCHDGQHVSAQGQVIRSDCDTCHTVIEERTKTTPRETLPGTNFKHPIDLGNMTGLACSSCHTGGAL